MYVLDSDACGLRSSTSPMPASAVSRQDAFIARVGRRFSAGNADMAGIVAALTPPQPGGDCSDFTNSGSMLNAGPFPWPPPPVLLVPPRAAGSGGAGAGAGVVAGSAPASLSFGSRPGLSPGVPGAGGGGAPAGSGGWVWTAAGGGSSYPWEPTQASAADLIPAWRCAGSAPAAAGAVSAPVAMGRAAKSRAFWAVFALGGLALLAAGSGGRR